MANRFLSSTPKNFDLGILLLRLGIGFMFIYVHGMNKMFGGPERWEKLGGAMGKLGIDFLPAFWGFMGAFTEFFGGILLLFGLFFRPATILLLITMTVAAMRHLADGDTLGTASHALELAIIFLALTFIGPGRYSLDRKLFR